MNVVHKRAAIMPVVMLKRPAFIISLTLLACFPFLTPRLLQLLALSKRKDATGDHPPLTHAMSNAIII